VRFAVFANVQGNLVALRAVLDAIDGQRRAVDRIICAGDLVGLGPSPNEVLDSLREREVAAVRGNYDDALATRREDSGTDFPSPGAEQADARALSWTRQLLSPENLQYLEELPRDLRLTPGPSGTRVEKNQADEAASEYKRTFFVRALFGGAFRTPVSTSKRVLIVHGSTRALNEFVREDTANSILEAIARDTQADVLVSGHAGVSFRRDAFGISFIGAGSVSGPYASPGVAEFGIVNTGDQVEVEFERVTYDPSEEARLLAESGLSEALTTARDVPKQL
jgi:predicted phosphodiesterase